MWETIATVPIIFAANPAPYFSIVIGICGLGGLIFTALRWQRDDTTSVITQQSTIFSEMKALNEELRTTAVALREERDALRLQVGRLKVEVEALRNVP